jgi:hypothetical protein
MKKLMMLSCLVVLFACSQNPKTVLISKSDLSDKIKGGWAGQVIGCTYGGPTEFKFKGKMIGDEIKIAWYDGYMAETYENRPGLYDDVYMDLTFVDVFEKEGLDAHVDSFAFAFANAEYSLWHANQAARYNILNGVLPPKSGHWLHNPHAEDIDFQIEADFAGLMSPGMVNTSSEICDKIGHIMNYGDGWYGGVYVAAMYSLAFISDDIVWIVEEALKTIPPTTTYYQCMNDVINWYKQNPENWKANWTKTMEKWGVDIGCPSGVFSPFNIDAKINSAWIIIGLLYGEGDFGKTVDISTRCGDDSDCNPASSGGILATVLGYNNIPDHWKQGLEKVESVDFKYTTISLNDVYDMGYRHAVQNVKLNGGSEDGDKISLKIQQPKQVKEEIGFKGHYPVEKKELGLNVKNSAKFEFDGIGFSVRGRAKRVGEEDYVFEADMLIDGKVVESSALPTKHTLRKTTPFWRFDLNPGHHVVEIVVKNPSPKAELVLDSAIIYNNRPAD